MNFIEAKTEEQIAFCKGVLFEFRDKLDEKTYIGLIKNMIANENFSLVYISNEDNTKAAGFVGYRIIHTLRTGWMIYIDDLYTNPEHRGKGFAGALLDYVDQIAIEKGIETIHLDSGYMLHDAHRLYLNKRYVLACNHFAKKVL